MPALVEAHAQDRVARLDEGGVCGEIRVGAAMGLHVGKFAAEQGAGAFTGQVLDHIDLLAPAVVAMRRIALGIFVGEHAAHGLEHGGAREVLGRDQLDGAALTRELSRQGLGDGGVGISQVRHEGLVHGAPIKGSARKMTQERSD